MVRARVRVRVRVRVNPTLTLILTLTLTLTRPDAAVRAAHVSLSRPLLAEYSRKRRWFDAPPSVVVLVGGEDAPSGGVYQLDERDESNLDLGAWLGLG